MKKILLFGAGKSATCLIDYLVDETERQGWELIVTDANPALAQAKIGGARTARVVGAGVEEEAQRDALVYESDIVISLLPPSLHILVARSCLKQGRNLLTASYMDEAIRQAGSEIGAKGLFFLYEMGLDPGIDHMSAMELIHRIHGRGGRIHSFKSHTGGLVAPSSDNNPWHYKISWNPRNVVRAGASGAVFREDGQILTRSYSRLFRDYERVFLGGLGEFAWYPNRDSLGYIPLYGLEETASFIRTTLRHSMFCDAWAAIVEAGLTEDSRALETEGLTYKDWSKPIQPFVNPGNRAALAYLGLFDNRVVVLPPAFQGTVTAADILQHLLETRLTMEEMDKDMIVMLHELEYRIGESRYSLRSSLVVEGQDRLRTAMARTVGLPLGIAAKLILQGKIELKGLHMPILPEIYRPVLAELAGLGIRFEETETSG